jgi:heme A synthase
VLFGLPRLVSTAHLVNALLILGGLLVLAAPPSPVGAAIAGRIDRLVRIGLPVLLLQLALGGYVRHAGAGLACPDFPLCSGAILPGHWLAAAHWVHRWLGVALLGWALHLAIRARGGALARPAILVAALAVLQVGLGIAAVVLRLAPPVRAFHAVVGYALWAMLVWIGARGGCWSGLLGTTPAPRADAPAAEVVHVA